MKTMLVRCGAVAAVSLSASVSALGGVVFSDNFDAENGGSGTFNYTGLANWTVSDGTIDLIGLNFFDIIPGNGQYLDLDGTSNDAGVITSNTINLGSGDYVLEFRLAGSQRGDTNTVHVSFLGNTLDVTLASSELFATYSIPVSLGNAASGSIVFDHEGGDQFGLLLDDVVVRAVPTPGAAVIGLGIAAAGIRRRGR